MLDQHTTRIADTDGHFLPRIRLERAKTQATCNGGERIRTNAYINMTGAQVYE